MEDQDQSSLIRDRTGREGLKSCWNSLLLGGHLDRSLSSSCTNDEILNAIEEVEEVEQELKSEIRLSVRGFFVGFFLLMR